MSAVRTVVQTPRSFSYSPDTHTFESRTMRGMLELVSLRGNIIDDDNKQIPIRTPCLAKKKTEIGTASLAG